MSGNVPVAARIPTNLPGTRLCGKLARRRACRSPLKVSQAFYWRPEKSILVFQFLCTHVNGELRPTEEAAEQRYFRADALPERISPVVAERINDSLSTQGVFRTQRGPGAREFCHFFVENR
jgi:hypothetical protein